MENQINKSLNCHAAVKYQHWIAVKHVIWGLILETKMSYSKAKMVWEFKEI